MRHGVLGLLLAAAMESHMTDGHEVDYLDCEARLGSFCRLNRFQIHHVSHIDTAAWPCGGRYASQFTYPISGRRIGG